MTYIAWSNDFALYSHDILLFSGFIPVAFALKKDFSFICKALFRQATLSCEALIKSNASKCTGLFTLSELTLLLCCFTNSGIINSKCHMII